MSTDHRNELAGGVLDDIVHRVDSLLGKAGAPVVVAIDGPSGAGKTTLAAAVKAAILERHRTGQVQPAPEGTSVTVRVFHMDNIYPGWDGLAEAAPLLVDWILKPLRRNGIPAEPLRWRRYDWLSAAYAEWHEWEAPDVLIVEGVASGAAAAAPYVDLLIWVTVPQSLRYERGIARDGQTYAPHWHRWQQQEAVVFARDRTAERAAMHIDGTRPFDRPR